MKKHDLSVIINDTKLNIRVGAILSYNNKVLIEKNKTVDFSVIPGGRIKTLENSKAALIRELKEEIGIDISEEESKLVALLESFFEFNNQKYHELYFIYRIDLKQKLNLKDGMNDLENAGSNYYLKTKEEIEKIKMLPNALKEILYCKEFRHYIINDIKNKQKSDK